MDRPHRKRPSLPTTAPCPGRGSLPLSAAETGAVGFSGIPRKCVGARGGSGRRDPAPLQKEEGSPWDHLPEFTGHQATGLVCPVTSSAVMAAPRGGSGGGRFCLWYNFAHAVVSPLPRRITSPSKPQVRVYTARVLVPSPLGDGDVGDTRWSRLCVTLPRACVTAAVPPARLTGPRLISTHLSPSWFHDPPFPGPSPPSGPTSEPRPHWRCDSRRISCPRQRP